MGVAFLKALVVLGVGVALLGVLVGPGAGVHGTSYVREYLLCQFAMHACGNTD